MLMLCAVKVRPDSMWLLQVAGTSSQGKRKDPKLIEKKQQVCQASASMLATPCTH